MQKKILHFLKKIFLCLMIFLSSAAAHYLALSTLKNDQIPQFFLEKRNNIFNFCYYFISRFWKTKSVHSCNIEISDWSGDSHNPTRKMVGRKFNEIFLQIQLNLKLLYGISGIPPYPCLLINSSVTNKCEFVTVFVNFFGSLI